MNKAFLFTLFLIPSLVFGLTPRPPQEEPQIMIDASGTCHVTLQTVEDRTYFTRVSTDLENWTYLLEIDEGDGTEMCYCFDTASAGSTVYVVFEWSDYQTQDVQNADFNFDGHTNIQNLQANTSPVAPNPDGLIPPLEDPAVPPGRNFVLRKIEINDEGDEKRTHEDYVLDAGFNITGVLDENGLEVAATENWPLDIEMEEVGVVTKFQLHGNPGGVEARFSLVYRYSIRNATGGYQERAAPLALVIPVGENKSAQPIFISAGGTNYPDSTIAPVEISVVFGIGPPALAPLKSRVLLENYLNNVGGHVKSAFEDVWAIPTRDNDGGITGFRGVEIADTETPLVRALQAQGRTVVFDGHSNFGIGPNFTQTTHKTLADFTAFGSGYTDLTIGVVVPPNGNAQEIEAATAADLQNQFHGIGDEMDVDHLLEAMTDNFNGVAGAQFPNVPDPEDLGALWRLFKEGWAYLDLEPNQIPVTRNNYNVPHIGGQRLPNDQGRGPGQALPNLHGVGVDQMHFTATETEDQLTTTYEQLIINVSREDIPNPLRYNTYFYNACHTGRDYIEEFEHGNYVFTRQACAVRLATAFFVQRTIEGANNAMIVNEMNQQDLAENGIVSYGLWNNW